MADFLADYSMIADQEHAGGGILWPVDQIFGSVAHYQVFGGHWGNPCPVVGRHKVPPTKKHVMKSLILSIKTPKYGLTLSSSEYVGATSSFSFGPVKIILNGTTHFEGRLAPTPYHRFPVAPGDEATAGMLSYAQHFTFCDGIVLPASESIAVTLDLLALSAGYSGGWAVTNVAMCGVENGVTKTLQTTTVHGVDTGADTSPVTLFSYTPTNDFTLKSIQVSSVACGLIGSMAIEYPYGSTIFMLPHMLGVDSATALCPFSERSYAGYGHGVIAIPLWGITFHEGEEFHITADPAGDNFVLFRANVLGEEINECEAGAGGGVGPGVLKSVRSAGPRS